ncbi:MAG: hypothetical protein ACI35O_12785 [Bacillaceae bacterium]
MKALKPILFVIGSVVIVVCAIFFYLVQINSKEPTQSKETKVKIEGSQKVPTEVTATTGKEEGKYSYSKELKQFIEYNHKLLETELCWGGLEEKYYNHGNEIAFTDQWNNYRSTYLKPLLPEVKKKIDEVKVDKELHNDLTNIEKLINISLVKTDSQSLRYIHRIFHDLDRYINNNFLSESPWGVTYEYKGKSSQVDKVKAYIHQNGQ